MPRPRAGFTLLELMISLTVMVLVLVLVFGAFRMGARAWEKGEKDVEQHQRDRVVLDLIRRQIASACPRQVGVKDQDPFYMRGDPGSLEFVSLAPAVRTGKSGMVLVRYEVREKTRGDSGSQLLLYEKDIIRPATDKEGLAWDETDAYTLIPRAGEIRFAYLRPPADKEGIPEWQDQWVPEADPGLPMAVRVTYRREADPSPLTILARIQAQLK